MVIAALGALKGRTGCVLLSGYFIAFSPAKVLAQVGLSSGPAQVLLVARSLPRGAVDSIGAASERRSTNILREVSVPVRISANTPYRLMAIRTDVGNPDPKRVWVRDDKGDYQLLESHSPIPVARGRHASGARELEVLYRLEVRDVDGVATGSFLPVRYELAINPQL
jgi:hypothetical protein